MTPRIVRRVQPAMIDVLSALLLVVAGVLLVWNSGAAVTAVAPPVASVSPIPPAPAAVGTMASAIVARNVFSSSRRAPTVRFTPLGDEPPSTNAMSGAAPLPGTESMMRADSVTDAPPRLYGIIAQDGVRRALLLLTASGDSPRLYAVGDRQNGYRVLAITQDRVVLATSTGPRTLRLVVRELRDSLENMP